MNSFELPQNLYFLRFCQPLSKNLNYVRNINILYNYINLLLEKFFECKCWP